MPPVSPCYLDCNATTPVEHAVVDAVVRHCLVEYGNSGSRTHAYGAAASKALRRAREQVADVVEASWEEVIFTSGATESNNLAILGLAQSASEQGRRHIVSTQIEHKAVLEPLQELARRGFDVTLVNPRADGTVDPLAIGNALRDDTFLVSVMHVNNETGIIQPLRSIGELLCSHPAAFHSDAAQGFGKELEELRSPRLDLISVSGHKIFGPKGIGALIHRPGNRRIQLRPLMFGGGQERGLRPGTVPVHLAVGLGVAADLAIKDFVGRRERCLRLRAQLLDAFQPLLPTIHGDVGSSLPHVINLRFGEIDSEAVMIALKDIVAISNGSACSSNNYEPSHVLKAMGLSDNQAQAATRWSWSHLTPTPNWSEVIRRIKSLN